MGDFYKIPVNIAKNNPDMIWGQQIVDDLNDNTYDRDVYKTEEDAIFASHQEMAAGYERRWQYLNQNQNDEELNGMLQKQIKARIAPVPKNIRKKVKEVPAQRAVASKTGFGKVKEKYRVFKRSFKNTNADIVTVRESDKLKAYKKNQDAFDRSYQNSVQNLHVPGAKEEEIDALKYFVDRQEVSTEEAKAEQITANEEIIKSYLDTEHADGKKQILNNACKELLNYEMDANMFTDAYLAANITSMVEQVYKFKAFKTLYDNNKEHFKSKEQIIDKLIVQRGKVLEDFVTGHLNQQGLQIDWATKTTTTISDKTKKTKAAKNQDRENLVKTTIDKVNEIKDNCQQSYITMLQSAVKGDTLAELTIEKRHTALKKKVADNPVIFHQNKDLLRKLTGKASRYADILAEMEAKIISYQKICNNQDDADLDVALQKNAAEYLLGNLKNDFARHEDQFRAYELTIISMVDGERSFNAEETYLINDTIATENIDANLTEVRVRKDYYEAYHKSLGNQVEYSSVKGEYNRLVQTEGLKNQNHFIKEWYDTSFDEQHEKEYTEELKKNHDIDPDLIMYRTKDDFFRLSAPSFEKLFLPEEGDAYLLQNYYKVKRMADQYDFIQKNRMLDGKTEEIYKNVTVNGKMAKHLLKEWEPYMFMIKTGIYLNLPLNQEGIPGILRMSQNSLKKLGQTIDTYKNEKGVLPKHMATLLELIKLQFNATKSKDDLHERYKEELHSDLECLYDNVGRNAEISYYSQKLYQQGVDEVSADMIKITQVLDDEMKTDDMLPREVKEGLGPDLYMATKTLFKPGAINPRKVQYDSKGNVKKDYEIVNQQKYEDNMRIANLLKMFWNDPSEMNDAEKKEIDGLMEKYLKEDYRNYDNDAFDIAINGYPAQKRIIKRAETERTYTRLAMTKHASSKLVEKLIDAGLGFTNITPDDAYKIIKDTKGNQERVNKLDGYLAKSGYKSDFTLANQGNN